uniref:CUB domain-containing protein n=1 Tax=Plectus sambesii TaxID=2011161 RepID=A0A914W9B8_9BILA
MPTNSASAENEHFAKPETSRALTANNENTTRNGNGTESVELSPLIPSTTVSLRKDKLPSPLPLSDDNDKLVLPAANEQPNCLNKNYRYILIGVGVILALAAIVTIIVLVSSSAGRQKMPCVPSNYSGSEGVLLSHAFNTSLDYGSNMNCMYRITAPASNVIRITVNSFKTEKGNDKLFIYDGSSAESPEVATWSGTVDAGMQLESTGNTLTAKFVTDGSNNQAGFSISYSQSTRSVCLASDYSGPDGVLLSPGFSTNQNYGFNQNCTYHVTVPANYVIRLTVNSFITEEKYDKLYIYDGSSTASPLLETWSGTVAAGRQVESTENTLTAKFVTDHSKNYAGFSIKYFQSNRSSSVCRPSDYSGPDGVLLSPGFSINHNYR